LARLQGELTALLGEKSRLQTRIAAHLDALVPDLDALDALEIQGTATASRAFHVAMDLKAELSSGWRDPVLPGIVSIVRRWRARLEG
jgi:hypothetical protein